MNSETIVLTATSCLEAFVRGANDLRDEQNSLNEKRQGTYVNGVLAAIVAGDAVSFKKAVELLEADIRANCEGIAASLGCKLAKDGKAYVVPGGLSSLKSYMLSAFEYGLDIGSIEEPVPFTQIRKAVQDIKAAEKAEKLTGDDAARNEIDGLLSVIAENAKHIDSAALTATINGLVKVVDFVRTKRAEADAASAKLKQIEAETAAAAKAAKEADKAAKAEAAAAKAAEAAEAAKGKAKQTVKAKAEKAKAAKSKAKAAKSKAAKVAKVAESLAAAA